VTIAVLAMTSFSDAITNNHITNCVASLKEAMVRIDTVTVMVIFSVDDP